MFSLLDDSCKRFNLGVLEQCLKYIGQHLNVPSSKISFETVHRNFKLASHPNKIIPLSESLHSTKSSSLFVTTPISSRILWNSA
jgi:hypothetical protein